MQDELKKIISHAMDTNSNLEQDPVAQLEGELSAEALESVAGGRGCIDRTRAYTQNDCHWFSASRTRSANNLV